MRIVPIIQIIQIVRKRFMANNNAVKKLIQKAITDLHAHSPLAKDEQWFSRANIGQQLRAPSFGLNPSRKGALESLVQDGVIEKRVRPNDGRGTLEFRLIK